MFANKRRRIRFSIKFLIGTRSHKKSKNQSKDENVFTREEMANGEKQIIYNIKYKKLHV